MMEAAPIATTRNMRIFLVMICLLLS